MKYLVKDPITFKELTIKEVKLEYYTNFGWEIIERIPESEADEQKLIDLGVYYTDDDYGY